MPRPTLTTTPAVLSSLPTSGQYSDVLVTQFSQTGVIVWREGPAGTVPTFDGTEPRHDFSKASFTFSLRAGRAMYAAATSGTVQVDVGEVVR